MQRYFTVTYKYHIIDIGTHESWEAAYRYATNYAQPFYWIYDEFHAAEIADIISFGIRDRQREYPDGATETED